MALITPEILEDVERALPLLLPYDLRAILRQMAMRYPQDFLKIVKASPVNRNVCPQRVYRTPDEFQRDPDLKQRCEDAATKWLDQNKVISAIKNVRGISGIGLKESKDFVESLPAYGALRNRRGDKS